MKLPENEKAEHEEFEALFKKNYNLFCNKVYVIVRDVDVAADIVQNVFVKFWRERESINVKISKEGYLYKACINESHNYIKSVKRRANILNRISQSRESFTNNVEEQSNYNETSLKIKKVIESLPPACKEVFLLSRYDEMNHQEIADFLNISTNTVNNHLKKALKLLRAVLSIFLLIGSF